MRKFLKGLGRELNPREPFIKKGQPRSINNIWTGVELGGKGKLSLAAGGVAIGGYSMATAPARRMREEASQLPLSPIPGTEGDGHPYEPRELVPQDNSAGLSFALHDLRYGG